MKSVAVAVEVVVVVTVTEWLQEVFVWVVQSIFDVSFLAIEQHADSEKELLSAALYMEFLS